MGRGWTAPDDEKVMIDFYNSSSRKIDGLPADRLIGNMEWRIYTEWCCNGCLADELVHEITKDDIIRWRFFADYGGRAFNRWIRDETHYALEMDGFAWNEQKKLFVADSDLSGTYKAKRGKVLQSSVSRAVDFFKDCREYLWPHEGDSRNLRISLEPYLKE